MKVRLWPFWAACSQQNARFGGLSSHVKTRAILGSSGSPQLATLLELSWGSRTQFQQNKTVRSRVKQMCNHVSSVRMIGTMQHGHMVSPVLDSDKECENLGLDPASSNPVIDPCTLPTGRFRSLMHVLPVEEMIGHAKKQSDKIEEDFTIRGARMRACKLATQRIQEFAATLTRPLKDIVQSFQSIENNIHPFERVVYKLVLDARRKKGQPSVDDLMRDVRELGKMTTHIAMDGAHQAKNAESKDMADRLRNSMIHKMVKVWEDHGSIIKRVRTLIKELRGVPVIDPNMSCVVLVGCPNVGKSSIVRLISTGTPEIANYPFTTRSMTIGHILDPAVGPICQVMDTPGLLARDESEHNSMELLTLAAVEYTAVACIFVLDLTGTAGEKSSVPNQLLVRTYLRAKFPNMRWIDVLSKSDMPRAKGVEDSHLPEGAIAVSCPQGIGKEELTSKLMESVSSELKA